jgi:hypothetical protein
MTDDAARTQSRVVQSFSHGRKHIVEVERIPSREGKHERPVLHLPKKKRKKQVAPVVPREAVKTAPKPTVKKKPRRRVARQMRAPAKPSFSNLPVAKSRLAEEMVSARKSKRQVIRLGGGNAGHIELSAGMPGNEDVDPPRRISMSTPADRARAILKG